MFWMLTWVTIMSQIGQRNIIRLKHSLSGMRMLIEDCDFAGGSEILVYFIVIFSCASFLFLLLSLLSGLCPSPNHI